MSREPLSAELSVFERHRAEWSRSHPGKYVVIQDEVILPEFFEEFAEAFRVGVKRFGVQRNFLVKQVWAVDPVYPVFGNLLFRRTLS